MHEDSGRHPIVHEFLDSVRARMGSAGGSQRAEDLLELGQHLDLLVAGLRQQGLSADAAAAAAVERFGRADQLGRSLRRARQGSIRRHVGFYAGFVAVQAAALLLVLVAIGGGANLLDRPSAFWPAGVVLLLAPVPYLLFDRRRRHRATP